MQLPSFLPSFCLLSGRCPLEQMRIHLRRRRLARFAFCSDTDRPAGGDRSMKSYTAVAIPEFSARLSKKRAAFERWPSCKQRRCLLFFSLTGEQTNRQTASSPFSGLLMRDLSFVAADSTVLLYLSWMPPTEERKEEN